MPNSDFSALCTVWWLPLLDGKQFTQRQKPHTHIFLCNLHCFEPFQGCCEQSLYRAQGHFCWSLQCFLRFLAAHNDPIFGPDRSPPPSNFCQQLLAKLRRNRAGRSNWCKNLRLDFFFRAYCCIVAQKEHFTSFFVVITVYTCIHCDFLRARLVHCSIVAGGTQLATVLTLHLASPGKDGNFSPTWTLRSV